MGDFFRDGLIKPIQTAYTPVSIRRLDGTPEALVDAVPGAADAVVGRWLNPGQTSRLERSLPAGTWQVKWEAELGSNACPESIQVAGERILVQCRAFWALYDTAGGLKTYGQMGPGDLLVDPEFDRFFIQRFQAGMFSAYSMDDGAELFSTTLGFASQFHRTYMTRLPGNRLAVAGTHRDDNPHRPPPELSGMEVWNFLDNAADGVKILVNSDREGVLVHQSLAFLVVRTPGGFAIAVPDGVYGADEALELTGCMEGPFTPCLLSADETGRLYLVVDTVDGQSLWVLTSDGTRLIAHAQPIETEGRIVLPPIVGYDHRIYLLTATMARCLDPSGSPEWECGLGSQLGGAAITTEGQLLVTAGDSVSTFDLVAKEDGEDRIERRVVATASGHTLGAAPILAPDGTLLVASNSSLICLEQVGS